MSETNWVLHENGPVRWITADCPICHNGVQIDLDPGVNLEQITFNHCRMREQVPPDILGGPATKPGPRVRTI